MPTMDRRTFFAGATLATIARPAFTAAGAPVPTGGGLKLGCQSGPTDEQRLAFFARHGVRNICGIVPTTDEGRLSYTRDELVRLRDLCNGHEISLDMIALPFMLSTHIDRTPRGAIVLGTSPERDRDIEAIQETIRNCAAAGVPAIKYNLNLLGVLRTADTPGRGGTRLSTWRLGEAAERGKTLTRAGRVTADIFWERIDYFLTRVVPVANEYKVRIACHPHDPGTPPGFQGVDCVLGTVDGIKKLVSLHESPYHGLNFCQGTVSEMLADPGREIFDVIRYFGTRRKIFNVHFRNIRGRRDSFQEVFPDEGDVDFVKAIRVYREVGYDGMLMPDHVPGHADDPDHKQAFAFCYGYIRALIQATSSIA